MRLSEAYQQKIIEDMCKCARDYAEGWMKEQRVSGNIWIRDTERYSDVVCIKTNSYEVQVTADRLEPKDLRALADRIEEKRSK